MRTPHIRIIVGLGVLAIFGILGIQLYWLKLTYSQEQAKFNEKVHIALIETAEDLARYHQVPYPAQSPVKQVESNYYVVNINGNIVPSILEFYLKKEFTKLHIQTDFEYGIYDCESGKMVYGSYVDMDNKPDKEETSLIPEYDIEDLVYYFVVRFPNMSSYLTASLQLWMWFTGILLVAIFFFFYAIVVILRQKRLTELQKDFINNMTHEFKTPITSIKIATDFLNKQKLIKQDSKLVKYLDVIRKQSLRLDQQVENVLQIARTERVSLNLNPERLNLQQLVEQVIEVFELKHDIKIEQEFEKQVIWIKGDELHLTNIIYSLLDNSYKYRKAECLIRVQILSKKGFATLKIIDNGIGIKQEYQKHIWKKFYRVPTGNLHDVKGFGLGLFYVKMVCDRHRWKLGVESEIEKGTQISILMKVDAH